MTDNKTETAVTNFNRLAQLNIDNSCLSASFKIWIAGFIFFLVVFHFLTLYIYPRSEIFSKELILGIVLALISYLWSQEVRDRDRLRAMNEDLILAQRKLQDAEIATIASLIRVEEAKDILACGHSQRVAKFAVAMAEAKGFSESTREMIRRAAILHDVGKLAISDSILQKPGKLSDEEWVTIKKHPQLAVEILEPLKFLSLEKKVILHHHERIDGTGYPAGLKGAEIPLESRIIAVADTFDAMNSSRMYREARSKEYILAELKHAAGNQLEASLVELFFRLLEQNPSFWERT